MPRARVGSLPDGSRGFDANLRVSRTAAAAFVEHGYSFAVRYVRRHQPHNYDLSSGEVITLLEAGLALMIVQHVAPEGWSPNADDGALYGNTAGRESHMVGIPSGVTVWCDLEGVKPGTPHEDVIGFCNAWYDEVWKAGYLPGLYVGWRPGLTAIELYRRLKFRRYWAGYNLNADQVPAVRGVQLRQSAAKASDLVPGFTNQNMDVNVIHADALGGTPTLLLPGIGP